MSSAITNNGSPDAVLVEFGCSMPRFSKKALDLATEAASNHNAAPRMHSHTERTLDKDSFAALAAWEANTRAEHRRRSVPFSDNGPRLIAAGGVLAYKQVMDDALDVGKALWADFLVRYDVAVQDARALRGDRFDVNDYPTVQELQNRFVLQFRILPMPSVGNLPQAIAAMVARDSQAAIDDAVSEAKRYVFKQLRIPVAHMVEKLLGYTGTRTGSFHGSLVDNILEIIDLLPSLNIDGDATIEAMGLAMRAALTTYTAEDLRSDDNVRADVAQQAQDILAAIDSFI